MESKSKKMIIVVSLTFIAIAVATLAITLPIVLRDGDEKTNSTNGNFTATTRLLTSTHSSAVIVTSTPIPAHAQVPGRRKLTVNPIDHVDLNPNHGKADFP